MSESRLTHEEDEDRADEEPLRIGLVGEEVGRRRRGGGGGDHGVRHAEDVELAACVWVRG